MQQLSTTIRLQLFGHRLFATLQTIQFVWLMLIKNKKLEEELVDDSHIGVRLEKGTI